MRLYSVSQLIRYLFLPQFWMKSGQNNNLKFNLRKSRLRKQGVLPWLFNKTTTATPQKIKFCYGIPSFSNKTSPFPLLQKSQVISNILTNCYVTPCNELHLTVSAYLGSEFWDFVTKNSFKESLHPLLNKHNTQSQEIEHMKEENMDNINNPYIYIP